MEKIIEIKNLTKDYGNGRGVFDINFTINKGETFGLVGANGAGKTTIIRNIMGFLKPDKGTISICGLDAWVQADEIKKHIGYVPGEIAFPDLRTGTEFLKSQAEFVNVKDMSYANDLIEKLQLDTSANLKRMSKGMKQKTAIVVAFLSDPEILILDEPSTGLDPLMRVVFLEIIAKEKKKGKTILMSSHLYEELETSCDKVALVDKGRIFSVTEMKEIKNRKTTDYKIEFKNKTDYEKFKTLNYEIIRDQLKYNQVTVKLNRTEVKKLFEDLTKFNVKFITEVRYNLEKHLNEIIKKEKEQKK